MKTAILLFPLIVILTLHAHCSRHEEIVNLTSPIVYALARNAAEQGRSSGQYTIELKFENIKKTAEGWPTGEVEFILNPTAAGKNQGRVQYILNGTHTTTAIVEISGNRKQFPVNLYESAIVFGQAGEIEGRTIQAKARANRWANFWAPTRS